MTSVFTKAQEESWEEIEKRSREAVLKIADRLINNPDIRCMVALLSDCPDGSGADATLLVHKMSDYEVAEAIYNLLKSQPRIAESLVLQMKDSLSPEKKDAMDLVLGILRKPTNHTTH